MSPGHSASFSFLTWLKCSHDPLRPGVSGGGAYNCEPLHLAGSAFRLDTCRSAFPPQRPAYAGRDGARVHRGSEPCCGYRQLAIQLNRHGRTLALVLIACFGLALIFPGRSARLTVPLVALGARLSRSVDERTRTRGVSFGSSALLGIATGLLWTPWVQGRCLA